MTTHIAPLMASPNKIIKNSRNMAIGLIILALTIIILSSGVLSIYQTNDNENKQIDEDYVPIQYTQNVVNNTLILNPGGNYFLGFQVPEEAKNARIQGKYTSILDSANNAVIITIWSQKEALNYLNCLEAKPCYNKDLMPMVTDNINVTLSKGNYFVFFDAASVDSKTVSIQLDLIFNR